MRIEHYHYLGSPEHKHYLGSGKEKGSSANAAIEMIAFFFMRKISILQSTNPLLEESQS